VICDRLSHPIVQAPLAGGPSTVDLAVAVSAAGGLGFLAAGYRTAEAVRAEIHAVRARTDAPFGVNVFVPAEDAGSPRAVAAFADRLAAEAGRYGVALGEPRRDDDEWEGKVRVLLAERPAVASFTFGCPPPELVSGLREAGTEVWITVTTPAEAHRAEAAGGEVVVVQGSEAGGHRGGFADSDEEPLGLLALLRLVRAASNLPMVAAGGIADGAAVAAVLAAGAAAAQLGTAFLAAHEAGTHPAHRAALATDAETALTRAFTGRRARGITNRFLADHSAGAPSAYPELHHLTAPLRAAARERGDGDGFNLWAGQAHGLAREAAAGHIVATLAADAAAAAQAAARRLTPGARTTRPG
jgi:nitronate monooxygenase